jgi:hypothetical protein
MPAIEAIPVPEVDLAIPVSREVDPVLVEEPSALTFLQEKLRRLEQLKRMRSELQAMSVSTPSAAGSVSTAAAGSARDRLESIQRKLRDRRAPGRIPSPPILGLVEELPPTAPSDMVVSLTESAPGPITVSTASMPPTSARAEPTADMSASQIAVADCSSASSVDGQVDIPVVSESLLSTRGPSSIVVAEVTRPRVPASAVYTDPSPTRAPIPAPTVTTAPSPSRIPEPLSRIPRPARHTVQFTTPAKADVHTAPPIAPVTPTSLGSSSAVAAGHTPGVRSGTTADCPDAAHRRSHRSEIDARTRMNTLSNGAVRMRYRRGPPPTPERREQAILIARVMRKVTPTRGSKLVWGDDDDAWCGTAPSQITAFPQNFVPPTVWKGGIPGYYLHGHTSLPYISIL